MPPRRSKFDNEFGALVSTSLAGAQMTQSALATTVGCSTAYVNQTLTGYKKPSPQWTDLIADTLNMTDEQRQDLHKAAAKQHGWKLDLTKP